MDAEEQALLEERIGHHLDRGELREAATSAIKGYGPQILGYLVAVLRDEESGWEAFSQFSEDLWKGIGAFRRESSFRTWAYKLAWHASRRLTRDAFRRRGRRLETEEISQIAQQVRTATAVHLKTAAKDRVARLRETLEPDEQTLLILRVDRNLSWAEVADVMSEPGSPVDVSALRKRFERVKKKLKEKAAEEGIG